MANLQAIQDRIEEKKSQIQFSDQLCEESVRLWVKDIKGEILKEEKEVYKLNVSKDPILMKEATDMLVETLSPRQLGNEVHTYAPELLADISSELNDHYDNQAKKHISTNHLNRISIPPPPRFRDLGVQCRQGCLGIVIYLL